MEWWNGVRNSKKGKVPDSIFLLEKLGNVVIWVLCFFANLRQRIAWWCVVAREENGKDRPRMSASSSHHCVLIIITLPTAIHQSKFKLATVRNLRSFFLTRHADSLLECIFHSDAYVDKTKALLHQQQNHHTSRQIIESQKSPLSLSSPCMPSLRCHHRCYWHHGFFACYRHLQHHILSRDSLLLVFTTSGIGSFILSCHTKNLQKPSTTTTTTTSM